MEYLLWGVYLLIALICIYPIGQAILNSDNGPPSKYSTPVDSMDRAFAGIFGVLLAGVWPLILTGWLLWKLSQRIWEGEKRGEEASQLDHR